VSILSGLKKVLGFDGVIDSGLKIIDKIAGTDWTAKEKAQFILDHAEKTKYQSKTRRAIAVVMLVEWALLVNVWLISVICGHMFESLAAVALAVDIKDFMVGNINIGMNAIMSFYFLMGLKK